MPFIVKPIEEIKSTVDPAIQKIENTEVDGVVALYLIFAVLVMYIFRNFFFGLTLFLFKLAIIVIFAFITYSLFFT
jgi:hypothetical protein